MVIEPENDPVVKEPDYREQPVRGQGAPSLNDPSFTELATAGLVAGPPPTSAGAQPLPTEQEPQLAPEWYRTEPDPTHAGYTPGPDGQILASFPDLDNTVVVPRASNEA